MRAAGTEGRVAKLVQRFGLSLSTGLSALSGR